MIPNAHLPVSIAFTINGYAGWNRFRSFGNQVMHRSADHLSCQTNVSLKIESCRDAGCTNLDVHGQRSLAAARRSWRWVGLRPPHALPHEPSRQWDARQRWMDCFSHLVSSFGFGNFSYWLDSTDWSWFLWFVLQFTAELFAAPPPRQRLHKLYGRRRYGLERSKLHPAIQSLSSPDLLLIRISVCFY